MNHQFQNAHNWWLYPRLNSSQNLLLMPRGTKRTTNFGFIEFHVKILRPTQQFDWMVSSMTESRKKNRFVIHVIFPLLTLSNDYGRKRIETLYNTIFVIICSRRAGKNQNGFSSGIANHFLFTEFIAFFRLSSFLLQPKNHYIMIRSNQFRLPNHFIFFDMRIKRYEYIVWLGLAHFNR